MCVCDHRFISSMALWVNQMMETVWVKATLGDVSPDNQREEPLDQYGCSLTQVTVATADMTEGSTGAVVTSPQV